MNESTYFSNRMNRPMLYRLWVEGEIDERWYDWFNEMHITSPHPGESCLTGVLPDQAALLGFLNRLYNKGYPIIRFESELIEDNSSN